MVSAVVISLVVWASIPHMGTWDPLGKLDAQVEGLPSKMRKVGMPELPRTQSQAFGSQGFGFRG